MRKRRPAGSAKSPIQIKYTRNSSKSEPEKHDDKQSKKSSRSVTVSESSSSCDLAHVNTSARVVTPHLNQKQRPLDGYVVADATTHRSRTRLSSNVKKVEMAEKCRVKPRRLGLNKSQAVQSPLINGAVKRKRKACPIILDDSDDDVVEIKDPLTLNNAESPCSSSTVVRTKPEVKLMSPEYRRRVLDRTKSEVNKKLTPSPLTTSTSYGSSDGISPRPSARLNQPVTTPLRTLLLDDILSSQAESQVDVKWDCRSPNAIRDAQMYQMGSDQDGSDLIAMLKQVEKQANPEHIGTPPPPPIFSMLCLPNDTETNLTRITKTKGKTTRMARRNSRKEAPKNAQSLEFLQKLAEYIQDQADVESDHNEFDLKEEGKRSPKFEFDLNEGVHDEEDSFSAEDDMFGNEEAVSSKIATQLEPSLLFNGVTPSAPCGGLTSYTAVDREIMKDMSVLKETTSEEELGADIVEKGPVKAKSDLVDEFCGDDTLDDLFGDDSFMEKATQMTKELFDEKTQTFKTPKVLGKVVTSSISSKDCVEQFVSSSSRVSTVPSGAPQLRQKLFANPVVSKSATSAPLVKTTLATAVCSTCVANRLPTTSSSCVSFPNNNTKTEATYVGQTAISSKPSGLYGGQSKQPSFPNNKWAKPATVSSVTSSNSNWVNNPPGIVSHAQTRPDVTKPTCAPVRAQTMPNTTVSVPSSQYRTIITNSGAKPPSRSSTIPAVKNVTNTTLMTNASQSIGQSFTKCNKPSVISGKTATATLSSTSNDAVYFGDLSLSEDLLFQLAEPDDILDSQVCNSGSSSGSVEQNHQADPKELSESRNKTKTAKLVKSQHCASSLGNKPNVKSQHCASSLGKQHCASSLGNKPNVKSQDCASSLGKQHCASSLGNKPNVKSQHCASSLGKQHCASSLGNKPNVRGSVNTSSFNAAIRPVSSQAIATSSCKTVVSNTMSVAILCKSSSALSQSGLAPSQSSAAPSQSSAAPSQSSTRKCFQIGNETDSRETSTLILEDSDLGIPPTPQVQSKFIKAQKFNFKSTNLSSSGANAVTRSQAKLAQSASVASPEKLQEKPEAKNKASQEKNTTDFGLGNDGDDDDDLFEPEVLAMLENAENEASQSSSQPLSQNQCSAEQIEKKKQEALKRRIEKKRQEAIKRREAQFQASQKAQAARSCNVGTLSQSRKTRKS